MRADLSGKRNRAGEELAEANPVEKQIVKNDDPKDKPIRVRGSKGSGVREEDFKLLK